MKSILGEHSHLFSLPVFSQNIHYFTWNHKYKNTPSEYKSTPNRARVSSMIRKINAKILFEGEVWVPPLKNNGLGVFREIWANFYMRFSVCISYSKSKSSLQKFVSTKGLSADLSSKYIHSKTFWKIESVNKVFCFDTDNCQKNYIFRNKILLFFKIEGWDF